MKTYVLMAAIASACALSVLSCGTATRAVLSGYGADNPGDRMFLSGFIRASRDGMVIIRDNLYYNPYLKSAFPVSVFHLDRPDDRIYLEGAPVLGDSACVSGDGKWAAGCDTKGFPSMALRIWQTKDGALVKTIPAKTRFAVTAFSPDGKWLAAAGAGGGLSLLTRDGSNLWTSGGDTNAALCLAFSADGSLIAAGYSDGRTLLFNTVSGAIVKTPEGFGAHGEGVTCAAFTPDGKKLLTCGLDFVLKVWDMGKKEMASSMTDPAASGGPGCALRLARFGLSPDGASVCWGASIRSLDGRAIAVCSNLVSAPWSPVFACGGRLVLFAYTGVESGDFRRLSGIENQTLYFFNPAINRTMSVIFENGSGNTVYAFRGRDDQSFFDIDWVQYRYLFYQGAGITGRDWNRHFVPGLYNNFLFETRLTGLARELADGGKPEQAAALLSLGIEEGLDRARAWWMLGICWQKQTNSRFAETSYRLALREDPGLKEARDSLEALLGRKVETPVSVDMNEEYQLTTLVTAMSSNAAAKLSMPEADALERGRVSNKAIAPYTFIGRIKRLLSESEKERQKEEDRVLKEAGAEEQLYMKAEELFRSEYDASLFQDLLRKYPSGKYSALCGKRMDEAGDVIKRGGLFYPGMFDAYFAQWPAGALYLKARQDYENCRRSLVYAFEVRFTLLENGQRYSQVFAARFANYARILDEYDSYNNPARRDTAASNRGIALTTNAGPLTNCWYEDDAKYVETARAEHKFGVFYDRPDTADYAYWDLSGAVKRSK